MKESLSDLQKEFPTASALIEVLEANSFSVAGLFSAEEDTAKMGCEVVLQRLLGADVHDAPMTNEMIWMKKQDRSLKKKIVDTSLSNQTAELAKFVKSSAYQKNAIDATVKSFFYLLQYDEHACLCALQPLLCVRTRSHSQLLTPLTPHAGSLCEGRRATRCVQHSAKISPCTSCCFSFSSSL